MGVSGAPHRGLFFSNSNLIVQNKVTETEALVLGGLKHDMTLLLQGIMGRGRSHPIYSDTYGRAPCHEFAILGLKGIKSVGGGGWI